jgi:hypothetical protein
MRLTAFSKAGESLGEGLGMVEDTYFEDIWDLDHDPDLAEALGNLLIVWAAAESRLVWVFSVVCQMDVNRAVEAYHRIPTFDSRTKVIRALLANWETKKYKPDEIAKVVAHLSRLSKTRNEWVHGSWMKDDSSSDTGVVNFRAKPADRGKIIKVADVENRLEAVRAQITQLYKLVPRFWVPRRRRTITK